MAKRSSGGATVLVTGLGDLGGRVVDALAREPGIERLIGAGRDAERGGAITGQAALAAELLEGPRTVGFERADLEDVEATGALLRRTDPDVIVMAASQHTWWRAPDELPYVAWLPLQVRLVHRLMQARAVAGARGRVVCLPFPDVVIPVLRGMGSAPEAGGGNVAEVAAKLGLLAAAAHSARRDEVQVRLVMHHAAERTAFGAFASLAGAGGEPGAPPWVAEVVVRGQALGAGEVEALFRSPYALSGGREAQSLTAAATAALVRALLSDEPSCCHVPGARGLPGGYPVRVSAGGIELDLPPGMTEQQAVAINESAARWDGVERIEADGPVVYTSAAAAACASVLGMRADRLAPGDHDAAAAELLARRDAPAR